MGCKEPEKNENKEKEDMRVQVESSRIVDFIFDMPPSLPMVSLVRIYVRTVRMPPSSWGCDEGRIANLALDEPGCRSVG